MLSLLIYHIHYELNFVSIYLPRLLIHKLGHLEFLILQNIT